MVDGGLKPGGSPEPPGSQLAPRRLAVVGGGISGLAAAHRAIERAPAGTLEVVLLEAGDRLGGVISTRRHDGFLVEEGPDSFITEKPAGIDLCRRIGLGDDLLPTNDRFRRTLIVRDGRLLPLPDGFQLLGPTRLLPFALSPVLSIRGRLAAAKDLVLPRGGPAPGGDESLASFVRRRLGNEVLERLAQPLAGGIYTADPETLSLASTMPRFLALEREHRSLIVGLRSQARRAGAAEAASGARFGLFMTLRHGMSTLVDALAARLPAGAVRLRTRVTGLTALDPRREPVRRGSAPHRGRPAWRVALAGGESLDADAVVVALPAPLAAALVAESDAELAAELSSIAYASSVVVSLAYRRAEVAHALDAFGFVVPAVERRRIIAGSFSSVKYPGRAPDGSVLLRVFVGGALQPDLVTLDDDAVLRLARDELRDLIGVSAEPGLVSIARWPGAMPQYRVGHAQRIAGIERRAAMLPGLALAGNAFHGVGLADCVRSGEEAADALLSALVPGEHSAAVA